jgi:hypothetical protein
MKRVSEWHQLKNGYWLKINFYKASKYYFGVDTWLVDIAVAKTKRRVNDHYNRTRYSPKSLYHRSTNIKGGIESLLITLDALKRFESTLPKGSVIRVEGTDEQRTKVYSRLLTYGYTLATWWSEKCIDCEQNQCELKYYYFKVIEK